MDLEARLIQIKEAALQEIQERQEVAIPERLLATIQLELKDLVLLELHLLHKDRVLHRQEGMRKGLQDRIRIEAAEQLDQREVTMLLKEHLLQDHTGLTLVLQRDLQQDLLLRDLLQQDQAQEAAQADHLVLGEENRYILKRYSKGGRFNLLSTFFLPIIKDLECSFFG